MPLFSAAWQVLHVTSLNRLHVWSCCNGHAGGDRTQRATSYGRELPDPKHLGASVEVLVKDAVAFCWPRVGGGLEPQITPRSTSFTRNYICKCNVNVNRGHWSTITLHLQGLFRHLHVIGVNDGLQLFLTVAGVSCAQNRLRQLIYVHIAS
jgi:hypothetical protein